MFGKLLSPVMAAVWPVTIEEVKHSSQKERRICDTLEPVLNSHRLVVNAKLIQRDYDSTREYPMERREKYQLFYQLGRITRDKGALAQDDRLDALAIAVAYFAAVMAADTKRAVEASRQEAMRKELRKFMERVTGRRPQGPVWAGRV